MRSYSNRIATVAGGLALLLLAGCAGTQNSRFYVLSAIERSEVPRRDGKDEAGVAIGIASVALPRYLDRAQIAVRASPNRLHLDEFNRWAGALKDNVAHVLAEDLSILLSTDRVAVFPWKGSTPIDFQLSVELLRFDGQLGGDVSLVARWTVFGKDGKQTLLLRRSQFVQPTGDPDHEAMVAALSRTLADLSREIAGAIRDLGKEKQLP